MKTLSLFSAALTGLAFLANPAHSGQLYQNGQFLTGLGAGYGGADVSVVQDPAAASTNTLGVTGWHNDVRRTNRLADDFTVPAGGWHLGRVTLYGYQTYAGTVSTITNAYLQIWNGCPTNPASTVVWGDLVTGRMTHAAWTHAYRVLPDELDSTRRAVMEVVAAVDVTLPAGTYWLDFMLSGITTNGPYCPPAVTNNPCTGNALAFRNGAWQPVTNTLGQGLDFPFVLEEVVTPGWQDMAPLPVAVSGAASALVGQKFYLLGGEESPRAIQVYNLLTSTWTADTNGLAADTAHASAVLLGTDLYLIGGDASDLSNAPVRVFHTTSETWETLATDPLPKNPAGVGCAVWAGKIYAFGGEFDSTAYRYDPAAAADSRWTALSNAPAQLMNASVAVVNGKLYVGAGTAGDGRQVWVYDPAGDSWAALPYLYYRHAGGQLWAKGNTLYVGGGAQGPYVVSYNTADGTNGTWYAESMLAAGRELFAFAQISADRQLMAGGLDATGNASTNAVITKTSQESSITTLTSSLNPSTYGSSVTLTATVTPSAASGTVSFKEGATTLGTGTLSGGTATYSIGTLTVGDHSVTAEYGGDGNYAASTSSALTQTVNPAGPPTRTPVQSGPWNDPATWGGTLPAAGDDILIPVEIAVTVGADPLAIRNLTIAGTLTASGPQTLQISGNYTNTGAFNYGSGTVEFIGSSNAVMTATSPGSLTFYNLKLNKDASTNTVTALSKLKATKKLTITKGKLVSASDYQDILIETDGTLELTSDITIGGDLVIQGDGTLTTADHKITFDGGIEQHLTLDNLVQFDDLTVTAGTTLIETESGDSVRVNGTLLNLGVIRKTQAVTGVDSYYFGLAGSSGAGLELDVTALSGADPLTAVQADRVDANPTNAPGTNTTGIYWTITPTGSDFTATLILPHDGLDAPQVCRHTGTGWSAAHSSSTADTVTREGLTAFGEFAVFNGGVAVAVRDTLGAIKNTAVTVGASVLTANDTVAAGFTLSLTGVTYTGGHGGAVGLASGSITYTPATDYTGSDAFTYTVSDGQDGTAVGTVAVTVSASGTGKDPSPGGIVVVGGTVTLTFRGVPNRTYLVQWSASVNSGPWHWLGTTKAGRTGTMTYEDTPPGGTGSRFYRIVYPVPEG